VRLFLDASVILAACGRDSGASRRIFDIHKHEGWAILASGYVMGEVRTNIESLGKQAVSDWRRLESDLRLVRDQFVVNWPVVFAPAKDRPVLFTALAFADVLLTLDKRDFGPLMGVGFYGLEIMKPGDFLKRNQPS
jgi:predicted nucleic acid-binding protein